MSIFLRLIHCQLIQQDRFNLPTDKGKIKENYSELKLHAHCCDQISYSAKELDKPHGPPGPLLPTFLDW